MQPTGLQNGHFHFGYKTTTKTMKISYLVDSLNKVDDVVSTVNEKAGGNTVLCLDK